MRLNGQNNGQVPRILLANDPRNGVQPIVGNWPNGIFNVLYIASFDKGMILSSMDPITSALFGPEPTPNLIPLTHTSTSLSCMQSPSSEQSPCSHILKSVFGMYGIGNTVQKLRKMHISPTHAASNVPTQPSPLSNPSYIYSHISL